MSRFSRAFEAYGEIIVKDLIRDDTLKAALASSEEAQNLLQQIEQNGISRRSILRAENIEQFAKPLFRAFAEHIDPTAHSASNYKYLSWVCKEYAEHSRSGNNIAAEDLYKIRDDLNDLEAFSRHLPIEQRDINSYESLEALRDTVRPHQQRREARQIENMEIDDKIMAATSVVYNGEEGRVVVPHTLEASRFWGRQTKWCISSENADHFKSYNERAPIYIYLPKPSDIERAALTKYSSFKFCGTRDEFRDELDQQMDRSLPCLQKLFTAAAKNIETVSDKRHFYTHGNFTSLKEALPLANSNFDSKDDLIEAVKNWPYAYAYAGDDLKNDPQCAHAALNADRSLYQLIPDTAFEDISVARRVFKITEQERLTDKLSPTFAKAAWSAVALGAIGAATYGYIDGMDNYYSDDKYFQAFFGFILGGIMGCSVAITIYNAIMPLSISSYLALTMTRNHDTIRTTLQERLARQDEQANDAEMHRNVPQQPPANGPVPEARP